MNLENLYRVISREYDSSLNIADLKVAVETKFNLNRKRGLKSFLSKEQSDYEGELSENKFKIVQNNALRSVNDGLYFFFTQINGEIKYDEEKATVRVHADVSETILGMVIASCVIYIVIMIFGGVAIGLFCTLIMIGVLLYGRTQVKKDFERFEQEMINELKLSTTKPIRHARGKSGYLQAHVSPTR